MPASHWRSPATRFWSTTAATASSSPSTRTSTLLSRNGRAATTISPPTSPAAALGTIRVTSNTTALQIGGIGQGFTINGLDNTSPGIESAAIYFQGSHSNAQIRDNEIVAAGDEGLLTEYGATISGFVIDGNEFSGTTFTGTPGGQGFSLAVLAGQRSAPARRHGRRRGGREHLQHHLHEQRWSPGRREASIRLGGSRPVRVAAVRAGQQPGDDRLERRDHHRQYVHGHDRALRRSAFEPAARARPSRATRSTAPA